MLNRRRFVYTMAGGIALGSGRWRSATAAGVSLEGPLTRDVFDALVRDRFSLLLGNRAATLYLVRIDDGPRGEQDQFTLVFEAPHDLVLLDGVYRIAHSTAGTTELFLQPAGHNNRYNYYKAAFNLLQRAGDAPAPPPARSGGQGWRFVP